MKPQFIYPTECKFPFDIICEAIVRELEARNFNVPGIEVKFDVYGSGEQKMRMVREVKSAEFVIRFGRPQGSMPGHRWNNIAACDSITIPNMALQVYSDDSGPSFYAYVGDQWAEDSSWFMRHTGHSVNSKLNGERRRYLCYKGAWDLDGHYIRGGRAPYLIHDDDLSREYSPKRGERIEALWNLAESYLN